MKYSPLLSAVALVSVVISGCIRQRDHVPVNSRRDYVPVKKDTLKGSGKLYLVPLGNFPSDAVNELATFYRKKYKLEVEILPTVTLSPTAIDRKRRQLVAERAIEILKQANPELTNDSQAVMIGLTNRDMYIARYNWRFSFSFRDQGKYAVVSSGRMHLRNGRQKITEELMLTRLRKMVTKNVGILYFRLPQSNDRRSVLYRDVGGIRELDYMGEEF